MNSDGEMQFAPGEVVALRSGGPGLTVLGTDGDRVRCVFFSDELGEFRETSLPKLALIAADMDGDEDEEDEEEEAATSDPGEAEDQAETSDEDEDEDEDDGDQPGDGKTAAA